MLFSKWSIGPTSFRYRSGQSFLLDWPLPVCCTCERWMEAGAWRVRLKTCELFEFPRVPAGIRTCCTLRKLAPVVVVVTSGHRYAADVRLRTQVAGSLVSTATPRLLRGPTSRDRRPRRTAFALSHQPAFIPYVTCRSKDSTTGHSTTYGRMKNTRTSSPATSRGAGLVNPLHPAPGSTCRGD